MKKQIEKKKIFNFYFWFKSKFNKLISLHFVTWICLLRKCNAMGGGGVPMLSNIPYNIHTFGNVKKFYLLTKIVLCVSYAITNSSNFEYLNRIQFSFALCKWNFSIFFYPVLCVTTQRIHTAQHRGRREKQFRLSELVLCLFVKIQFEF